MSDNRVYRSVGGTPDQNMIKLIDLMGGIQSFVNTDDIVIIKPNAQWWNQGGPNLLAVKTLIDLIMNRPRGFSGEVILGENCHRGCRPWEYPASGWAHVFVRNADMSGIASLNDLAGYLEKRCGDRFSVCHWIDVGAGGRRVYGPADGSGYVYCDGTGGVPLLAVGNGAEGNDYREVIMSYPIMETRRGTVVDFKNGVWSKGVYTQQPLKFINLSVLNHHSIYCGVTGSVKNYFGITDLSGGSDPFNGGRMTGPYYNFHSFALNKWAPGPVRGMLGAAVGYFMKHVRKADLNIISAEWIGLASRTEAPAAHTKTILAASDPVSLDYHAARYVLYPNSRIDCHDPGNKQKPFYCDLKQCAAAAGLTMPGADKNITSYNHAKMSSDNGLAPVRGRKCRFGDARSLVKYACMRFLKMN